MADKKNGFMLYKSQWEAISDLEDKYLGQLLRAIFEYQMDKKEPEKHDIIYRDFKHFKAQFIMDDAKYQDTVERRKESGSAGGKQRVANQANATFATNFKQTQANQANQADNDNVNDNDITITPISPFPPEVGKVARAKRVKKPTKEETTKEQAILHYKTESEAAILVAPAEGEKYANLGWEICGMRTVDCPAGMVKTIMRLPTQLYFDQYQKLCAKLGSHEAAREILIDMHNNYDQYLSKGKDSIYLIALDWHRSRLKRDAKAPTGKHGSNVAQNGKTISNPKQVSQ